MAKKFYKALDVPENATDDDIKKAYRKLALKYHPDKNKSPGAETRFKDISEAYDTLSDKEKRRKYDLSGDAGVKIPESRNNGNNPFGGYGPNFSQFFSFGGDGMGGGGGNFNHHHHFADLNGGHPFYRAQSMRCPKKKKPPPKKDPPITHDLLVSLEDVLIGCTKKIKIGKNITTADGTTTREEKIITINVKPGWKAGTKITFKNEGDQRPDCIPADIIFVVKDKEHLMFQRDGCDIKYVSSIQLKEALCGVDIMIPSLTGESIPLKITNIVRPDTEHRFVGRGLPQPKDSSKRGDLVVSFKIEFPDFLSASTKKILMECLPS